MKKFILMSAFLGLLSIGIQAQNKYVGQVVHITCAEDNTYKYLLPNNLAMDYYDGPGFIQLKIGTWQLKNNEIHFQYKESYEKEGYDGIIGKNDYTLEPEYKKYKAIKKNTTQKGVLSLDLAKEQDYCYTFDKHNFTQIDPHALLRLKFKEKYPFTKSRLVTHSDVANLSKQELRLMRNEIFARYGLIFNSADLKKHFNSLDGYEEKLNDVTAFLSDIELKNIDFIKKYE